VDSKQDSKAGKLLKTQALFRSWHSTTELLPRSWTTRGHHQHNTHCRLRGFYWFGALVEGATGTARAWRGTCPSRHERHCAPPEPPLPRGTTGRRTY